MAGEERGPAWETYGLDQAVVEGWVRRAFGDKVMDNPLERAARVLEEAAETFQASGGAPADARAIVELVFSRPVGALSQEVGGVIVTLLALCAKHDLRLDDIVRREIERILSKDKEDLRATQQGKADLGIADRPE